MNHAGSIDRRAGRVQVHAVCLVALGAVLFGIATRCARPEVRVERTRDRTSGMVSVSPLSDAFVGVGSCASAACHGSATGGGFKGREYSIWAARDRHAKAFEVLTQPRSQRIARLYRGQASALAENDGLCLGCHVAPEAAQVAPLASYAFADGVGCESCHGAAGRWLVAHTTFGWNAQSDEQKRLLGFRPLKSLPDRAEACVGCHVGRPGVEVNHDVIAAGHPRLAFELSAFHALMPHHWDDRADLARNPDFEARAWLIGQLRSARAALDLLGARAQASSEMSQREPGAPWPELSEYSCFACHHDLRGEAPAIGERTTKSSGRPHWGTWYTPLLRTLAEQEPANPRARAALSGLDTLARLMNDPVAPSARVGALAQRSANDLAAWTPALLERTMSPEQIRGLFVAIASPPPGAWDANTERYLALAALHKALDDLSPGQCKPGWAESLRAMQRTLAFPPRNDSPGAASASDFAKALEQLKTQLGP